MTVIICQHERSSQLICKRAQLIFTIHAFKQRKDSLARGRVAIAQCGKRLPFVVIGFPDFPPWSVPWNAFFLQNIPEMQNRREYLFSKRISGNMWKGQSRILSDCVYMWERTQPSWESRYTHDTAGSVHCSLYSSTAVTGDGSTATTPY